MMKKNIESTVSSCLANIGVRGVLLGISGGADSVALLLALIASGVKVEAVHCNFHLRGDESDRDCKFVKNLCSRLGVDLKVVEFDVERYRKEEGGSIEMACRELRYAYFRKGLAASGLDRIAVAHNSDDNAETVLLNLMRGSGLAGLRGMRIDTGEVIRPLLPVSREEIEEYLKEKGEKYIVDSSNLRNDYRRNFLRNKVIPILEEEWPEAKRNINKSAAILEEEERAILEATEGVANLENLLYNELKGKGALGKALLRRYAKGKGATDKVISEIWRELNKEGLHIGARWILPGGELFLGRDGIEWVDQPEEEDLEYGYEITSFANSAELMEKIRREHGNKILWLPFNPEGRINLRYWEKGDRIRPLGMKGSRLVSDIVREAKICQKDKQRVVIAQDMEKGEILWVEGLKRSRKSLIEERIGTVWRIAKRELLNKKINKK